MVGLEKRHLMLMGNRVTQFFFLKKMIGPDKWVTGPVPVLSFHDPTLDLVAAGSRVSKTVSDLVSRSGYRPGGPKLGLELGI